MSPVSADPPVKELCGEAAPACAPSARASAKPRGESPAAAVRRAGVCFYQRESLPGYSAIFRHPNDELNYCYYLIPCGKDGMCGDVTARPAPKPSPKPFTLMTMLLRALSVVRCAKHSFTGC